MHVLIKEDLEQTDIKDSGLGSTHVVVVRPASERDPTYFVTKMVKPFIVMTTAVF